jgi:hypothetical protein
MRAMRRRFAACAEGSSSGSSIEGRAQLGLASSASCTRESARSASGSSGASITQRWTQGSAPSGEPRCA